MHLKHRWINLLLALDQFANVLLGGQPDETISSRAYRGRREKWYWRWLAAALDRLDPGHSLAAWEAERRGRQQDPDARP